MTKIPIFIIVHNQFECLKRVVKSYETQIKNDIEIIFHNVDSQYYETLNFLKEKEREGYKVYNSKINNHHLVVNSVRDYISKHPECEYCIITDPDIELYNVNKDILDLYIYALNILEKTTIGPMLEINDIPDYYHLKKQAIKGHTDQFWSKPVEEIQYYGYNYKYISCNTDTTFQLFSVKNIPKNFPHSQSIRFFSPYSAKHLDWYINPNNLYPCQLYCYMNSSNISHWNSKTWKGEYRGTKITSLTESVIPNYKYINYYDKCKCKNNSNFGDMITKYIYMRLTGREPINDITGGQSKEDVVFGAGSILHNSKVNSIIWGSGFMWGDETISQPKKIISVRGPLSRKRLLETGINCPEKYGDIGLILPYFFSPRIKKKYKVGIIPHYIDVNYLEKIGYPEEVKIIDVTDPVETFIIQLLECDYIMSSSLHGIITAHAYGIKCLWIKLSNKIGGGNFKYRDYYGSLNVEGYDKLEPHLYAGLTLNEMETLINDYPQPVFPINIKDILVSCPFVTFKK